MKTIRTNDGYIFYSCPVHGWVDTLDQNGDPYQLDMRRTNDMVDEWIAEGFAEVFEWSDTWTPIYEGPFDSEEQAKEYREWEVNRILPTRIRSTINKADGKTLWWIDCKREVTA